MDFEALYGSAHHIVGVQHCAFGDDLLGYCEQVAVEHIWVVGDYHTMACAQHRSWFDIHQHLDRHPTVGPCGLPGATWIASGNQLGRCVVEGLEHLVTQAEIIREEVPT